MSKSTLNLNSNNSTNQELINSSFNHQVLFGEEENHLELRTDNSSYPYLLLSELTDEDLKQIQDIHSYSLSIVKQIPNKEYSVCFKNNDNIINLFKVPRQDYLSKTRLFLEYEIFRVALIDYYKIHYPTVDTSSELFQQALIHIKRNFTTHRSIFKHISSSVKFTKQLLSSSFDETIDQPFEVYNDVIVFGFDSNELRVIYKDSNEKCLWKKLILSSVRLQQIVYGEAERNLESINTFFKKMVSFSNKSIHNSIIEHESFSEAKHELNEIHQLFKSGNPLQFSESILDSVIPFFRFRNYDEAMKVISYFDLLTPSIVSRTDPTHFWVDMKYPVLSLPNILQAIQDKLISTSYQEA